MADLLNIDDALAQILETIETLPAEEVSLAGVLGRVLAQDAISDISLPQFANSSMDGFALRAEDVVNASPETPAQLALVMDIPAGALPGGMLESGQAARIMTGAPLPDGADAVVPIEATVADQDPASGESMPATVRIMQSVNAGDYVRPVGEDILAGQTVIRAGTALRPQHIGVLASIGRTSVSVIRQPRVAIISTGDELVDVDEPLSPGKVRNSNNYVLAALVTSLGGIPLRIPTARDTLADTRRCFRQALLSQPDVILSSAGVSIGAYDVVRTALNELGEVSLWRINLRPGKPLAFGHLEGVPFFGLPGNPVSVMVTFDVIARPALLKLAGKPDVVPTVEAILGEDADSDGRRTYMRVRLTREGGEFIAHSTGTQSSGAQMSMVLADGLLIIPEGRQQANAGERFPVRLLRDVGEWAG